MRTVIRKTEDPEPAVLRSDSFLSPAEERQVAGLDCPTKIQAFLNTLPYSEDHFYRCPLRVLRDRKAHCFDGALFAAMALRRLGHPPKVLELIPNERDDDHLLALYRQGRLWGALAQSNFPGLRFREPIHRTLHELAMSYFEDFFNTAGEKTLRGYRGPIHLKVFDRLNWMGSDAGLEELADGFDRYRTFDLLNEGMALQLARLDERGLSAGLTGTNPAGLFKVPGP